MATDQRQAQEPCLALALRRADRVVTQIYNRHFQGVGLRGTQYTVLRAIGEDGCATARTLSERLLIDQTTASRSLKTLAQHGYLTASEGPLDRRERLLCLTEQGRAVLEKAHDAWEAAQAELKAELGKTHSKALLGLSARIADLAGAEEPGS